MTWVAVAAIGGVCAILRFLVDGLVSARVGRVFPYGTLVVNLTGAFVLGVLAAGLDGTAYRLAGTAAVGSYTTFSTWMLESHRLAEDGRGRQAAANVAISLLAGLVVAALGHAVGRSLWSG
jgi:CrcB protein